MNESISTRLRPWGIAEANDLVLSETPRTRIVFKPELHADGVRGNLVRQKIGLNGNWVNVNEVNFTHVPADCGVRIELDTAATSALYEGLSRLYSLQGHGIEDGIQRYVVARPQNVLIIDDSNKAAAMRALLDQGHSEQFWDELNQRDPDLAARLAAAKIQDDRCSAVREFESSLRTCSGDEDFWQDFFAAHPWMLQSAFSVEVLVLSGETYLGGKAPIGRQGKGGVATDYLMSDETTKSFAVVEIKTPDAKLLGSLYRGKSRADYVNEVYSIHSDFTGSVVQLRNQISVAVDHFDSVLGKHYRDALNRTHPIGVLVIGSTAQFDRRQRDSFNHFRHSLHGITVITFDEIVNRLKRLLGVIEEISSAPNCLNDDDIPLPPEPEPYPAYFYDENDEIGD